MFLLSLGLVFVFVGFGAWWLALESSRKQREKDLNSEYDAEMLALQAEADRKLEHWKQKLAAKQRAARDEYELEVRAWENSVAPLKADVHKRREAWEKQLDFQLSEARNRYESEVAQWKGATDVIKAEAAPT